jgi:hypothetical protein
MPMINIPGAELGRPPFLHQGVKMTASLIAADAQKLDKLVKKILTFDHNAAVRFEAVGSKVLAAVLVIDKISSTHYIDRNKGTVSEKDFGFWLPVFGGDYSRPSTLGFRWLPMFMLVEPFAAVSVGREYFGFPKSVGRFSKIQSGLTGKADPLKIDFFGYDKFDANAVANWHPAIDWDIEDIGQFSDSAASWSNFATDLARDFIGPPMVSMPMVFRKQIPSGTQANLADLDQIIALQVKAQTIRKAGIWESDQALLRVFSSDSYNPQEILGIRDVNSTSKIFEVDFDFLVGYGEEL